MIPTLRTRCDRLRDARTYRNLRRASRGTTGIRQIESPEPDFLIVEDNDDVRAFAADAAEAAEAAEAVRVLEGKTSVDLLFTDIGLPGVNGRELVISE